MTVLRTHAPASGRRGRASACFALLNEIAGFNRSEGDHAHRHREGQHEHDNRQFGAPVGVLATPHQGGCARGEDKQQRKRQGCARRGENVEHHGRFPHRARMGLHGKSRHRSAFLIAGDSSESRHKPAGWRVSVLGMARHRIGRPQP